MGLNFKSLFFEEEPNIKKEENNNIPKPENTTTQDIDTSATPVDTSATKKVLRDSLEESDTPEFNYIKYKRSLSAMKDVILDEKTRYVSSYITAKTLGLSKAKLIKTAEDSLKKLDSESLKFNDTLKIRFQETVGTGQAKAKNLTDLITKKTQDLQKLTEEITNIQKQKTEVDIQASKDQNKLDSLKRNFELAYQEISNEVKSDITKIKTYLEE